MLYRRRQHRPEVFLVHPGGPFWAKKDAGAWSIPKGEVEPGEDLLERARREVVEETGFVVEGTFVTLAPIRQSAKTVHAWAVEWDGDAGTIASNTFRLEYPPGSGRLREFPEVDKAAWFDLAAARGKIVAGQRGLLDQLAALLQRP